MTAQYDPERNEQKTINRFADFPGRQVLEVGCGEGRLTWKYAASAGRVIGVDPDLDALRVARLDRPHALVDKIHLAGASARWLPFAHEKFDIAVLAWSL